MASPVVWFEVLSEDYRNFRPDRMEHLELLPDRFDPAEGEGEEGAPISLEGYLEEMETEAARHGFVSSPGTGTGRP